MFARLFLAFTLTTTAELLLLLVVGKYVGIGWTIAGILVTGAAGGYLAAREGRRAWGDVVESLARGELPTDPIVQALLVLSGGLLLLTPGLLTDTVGFLCLIPASRGVMSRWLRSYFSKRLQGGTVGADGRVGAWTFTAGGSGEREAPKAEPDDDRSSRRKTVDVLDQQ